MRRILEMLFPWRGPAFRVKAVLYNGKYEPLPVQFGTRDAAVRDVLMRWRMNFNAEIIGYIVMNDEQETVFTAPASIMDDSHG